MTLDPAFTNLLRRPRLELVGLIPSFLAEYVHPGDGARERVRAGVERVLREATDAEWSRFARYIEVIGSEFGAWDADPLGRRLMRVTLEPVVKEGSSLLGLEHLDAATASGRPLLIAGNHLSYADPSVTQELFRRSHREVSAALLTAVAGPKVYREPLRLLGAAAMNTIKVAQSSAVASEQQPMSAREIARAARRALADAQRLMGEGRIVLLYPEGTRSRTGALGPFLKATARWATLPDLLVLPLALLGSDGCYTLEDDRLQPALIHGRFGPAVDTARLTADGMKREQVLETVRTAVAQALESGQEVPVDS